MSIIEALNNKHGNRAASKSVTSPILAPSLLFLFRAQILNYIYTIEVVSSVKSTSLAHSVLGSGLGSWVLCLVVNLHFSTDLEPLGVSVWGRAGLELCMRRRLACKLPSTSFPSHVSLLRSETHPTPSCLQPQPCLRLHRPLGVCGGSWWLLPHCPNSIHHHSGFSESSPTSHCEQKPHLNSVWLLDSLAAAALLQLFPLPDASTKHLTPVFKSLGY